MTNNKTPAQTAGWSSTWSNFLATHQESFLAELEQFHNQLPWTDSLDPAQLRAWQKEYTIIQSTLNAIIQTTSIDPSLCWIAFEQELPGEAGKRAADVNLILPTGHLFVIEFKDKQQASEQEVWRASFDLNTLLKFHSESIELEGHGFLALTAAGAQPFEHNQIQCDFPSAEGILLKLHEAVVKALQAPICYDTHQWQHGYYHRQPSILAGTVEVFFRENIPTLHTDAGQNIIEARQSIQTLYQQAKEQKKRFLVLVGGAPGAGKTLLGLSAVADTLQAYQADQCAPVYLSGNNPLVGVLQYTLDYYGQQSQQVMPFDARSIILPVLEFKKQFTRSQAHYDLVVFDEAQRAWDNAKMIQGTEIDLFCEWLSQKEYGVTILLIGDGQAIHRGEMPLETMLSSLADSFLKHQHQLTLVTPSNYQHHLTNIESKIIDDSLYLTSAIRQHFADSFEQWVEAVIEGSSEKALAALPGLQGFPLKITNSRETAENFAKAMHQELHQSKPGKADQFRYGWLTSSKSGDRSIRQLFGGKMPGAVFGPWFVHPPHDPESCCQLNAAATEFGCQGLEISLALVKWGDDLLMRNGEWQLNSKLKREHDDFTFATYRVLLSRGRSGLLVCCEDTKTNNFLTECGMQTVIQNPDNFKITPRYDE